MQRWSIINTIIRHRRLVLLSIIALCFVLVTSYIAGTLVKSTNSLDGYYKLPSELQYQDASSVYYYLSNGSIMEYSVSPDGVERSAKIGSYDIAFVSGVTIAANAKIRNKACLIEKCTDSSIRVKYLGAFEGVDLDWFYLERPFFQPRISQCAPGLTGVE